jgi:hypothetical protein
MPSLAELLRPSIHFLRVDRSMSSSNLLVIAAIQRWSKRQYLVAIEKSPVMATGP